MECSLSEMHAAGFRSCHGPYHSIVFIFSIVLKLTCVTKPNGVIKCEPGHLCLVKLQVTNAHAFYSLSDIRTVNRLTVTGPGSLGLRGSRLLRCVRACQVGIWSEYSGPQRSSPKGAGFHGRVRAHSPVSLCRVCASAGSQVPLVGQSVSL